MENNTASAPAAVAAQENSNGKEEAPAACFKRAAVPEDATFVEAAKEQLKVFTEAPMEEHWSCIKNTVRSMFEETTTSIFGVGGKDDATKAAPTSVESQ
ncbi:unnamed protein product [Alopecurus aequalis]